MRYVLIYLAAIVFANLLFAHFLDPSSGYSLSAQLAADFVICFGFIGLDLTLRDKLHENWRHNRLWMRMPLLILTGSLLSYAVSYAINYQASEIVGRVAMASFVAFAAAATVDFLIYSAASRQPLFVRVNASNIPSALVDSLVFPLLAFGLPMMWSFFAVEFAAKLIGGVFWAVVMIRSGVLRAA